MSGRWMIGILLVGVSLRLLLAGFSSSTPGSFYEPDSHDYVMLSRNLAEGRGFVRDGEAELFRAPGYPTFLALIRKIVGDAFVPVVLGIQILLDMLLCYLVFNLGGLLLKGRVPATVAMGWQSLAVGSMVYACKILSETLFSLLLMVLVTLLVADRERVTGGERPFSGIVSGLLVAVLVYIRSIALPLALGVPLLYALRRRTLCAGLCLVSFIVAVAPWIARNRAVADYSGLSTVGAITFYRYHAAALRAEQNGTTFAHEQQQITRELAIFTSQSAAAAHASRKWPEILSSAPFTYLLIHMRSLPMVLLPNEGEALRMVGAEVGGRGTLAVVNSEGLMAGFRHYFQGNEWCLLLVVPTVLLLLAKYGLALFGFARALGTERRWVHLALGVIVIYLLALPGPDGHPRFRVPVEPILSIYAALGAWHLFVRWGARSEESPRPVAGEQCRGESETGQR